MALGGSSLTHVNLAVTVAMNRSRAERHRGIHFEGRDVLFQGLGSFLLVADILTVALYPSVGQVSFVNLAVNMPLKHRPL